MKILLAVDGSDQSYDAVQALKYIARADRLVLLHVLNVPRPAYPMMMPEVANGLYLELERSMREEGERLLDRTQSLLPPHVGPAVKMLRVGSPAEVIATTVEEEQVDLVVLGARGLGPIEERVFGSVSHRVLTLASCGKLIVNGPVKTMRQVLLPLQGIDDAEAAVRFLQSMPFREPPSLRLLTVLPSVVHGPSKPLRQNGSKGWRWRVRTILSRRSLPVYEPSVIRPSVGQCSAHR